MNRKDELIKKRDLLQKQRNNLNNKRVSKNMLYLYVCGIALCATVSSVLFLETAPILIYLFSFLFTFGVPCTYFCKNILKDNKLKDEIAILDKDIIDIEREESRKEMYSRGPKPLSFKNIDDKRSALDVVSDGLKKMEHIKINPVSDNSFIDESTLENGPKLSLRK